MVIRKKHPRGSSGLQESENKPDESSTLPDLHRRNPSESPVRRSDPDEERWQDDGGESGEVV